MSRNRNANSPARASRSPRQRRDPLLSDIGELGLFDVLRNYVECSDRDGRLAVGFGDDTAVWDGEERAGAVRRNRRRGGKLLLATTDTMVEGTHFRLEWASWREVGRKLVASNVSDIAAMGGRPTLALVSLACPPSTTVQSVKALYAGIRMECKRWGATLAGGDSVRAEKIVLTLTLLGEKDRRAAPCSRAGLVAGQRVYVTGWPGESGAGLELLMKEGPDVRAGGRWTRRLLGRHLTPTPRLAAGEILAAAFPDLAMIDVSDGVDHELRLLASASNAEIAIELDSIPVSAALRAMAATRAARAGAISDPRAFVLFGGEDYELLFAARANPEKVAKTIAAADPRLSVHEIGRVVASRKGGGVVYLDAKGRPSDPPRRRAFEHFDGGGDPHA